MMGFYFCANLKKLTDLSLPMIVNALVQEAQYTSTMIYVGRLGAAKYLGAATLGNMLCNITGFSLAYGLCSALDTLIAQSYGAKEYSLMGLHAQRAAVIMTLFAIPVAAVWLMTEWIVHYGMGIDAEVSRLAGYWARWILLGLWPNLMFQILRRLLQGCGIIWHIIVSSAISTVVNIISNYILIDILDWGFDGAAISVGVAQWAGFIGLVLIIYVQATFLSPRTTGPDGVGIELGTLSSIIQFSPLSQDDDETWSASVTDVETLSIATTDSSSDFCIEAECDSGKSLKGHPPNHPLSRIHTVLLQTTQSFIPSFPFHEMFPAWSSRVWSNWPIFLELGMPGAFSLFLEWGSYELMAMISGKLGTTALATHGVFMTSCAIVYMIPQAVADATAVLAGNYLGNNDIQQAKSIIIVGMSFDMCIGVFAASMLLFVLRSYWGPIFTSDHEVQIEVYEKLPIMFIYITVDSMKCIALNVLRSTGRPQVTMFGNIFCCIAIMLPLGWYWAIVLDYGLWGVWGAMSIGWLCATIVYVTVLLMTDWEAQAKEASRRIAADSCKVLEHEI